MVRQRFRIRFSKKGNLKFIGHRDLLRALEALFRRAKLPLAMSEGFHPKPRMSFPCALALGFESRDEVLELEMHEAADTVNPDVLLADLNNHSVEGLEFLSAQKLDEGDKKAKLVSSNFVMNVPDGDRHNIADRINSLLNEKSYSVKKQNGKTVDVRESVADLRYSEITGALELELLTQDGPEAGVREVLTALELGDALFKSIFPIRTRCNIQTKTLPAV